MNKKITVTGANIIFFIVLALCLLFSIILAVIEAFDQGFIDGNFYLTSLIIQFVIILVPVLIYMAAKGINIREAFRFNRLDPVPAVIIALISVPALLVASTLKILVIYLLQSIGTVPNDPIPVPGNFNQLLISFLVIAVSPAICEEILNRGLMLRAYENRGSIKAVVISSIFFGFFHFDVTNLLGPIFLGLLIGYYVIKTNSIFAGMLAHFLNNGISELMSFYSGQSQTADEKLLLTNEDVMAAIFWGVVGLIAVVFLLRLFRIVTKDRYRLVPAISGVKNDVVSILSHWPVITVMAMYLIIAALYFLSLTLT